MHSDVEESSFQDHQKSWKAAAARAEQRMEQEHAAHRARADELGGRDPLVWLGSLLEHVTYRLDKLPLTSNAWLPKQVRAVVGDITTGKIRLLWGGTDNSSAPSALRLQLAADGQSLIVWFKPDRIHHLLCEETLVLLLCVAPWLIVTRTIAHRYELAPELAHCLVHDNKRARNITSRLCSAIAEYNFRSWRSAHTEELRQLNLGDQSVRVFEKDYSYRLEQPDPMIDVALICTEGHLAGKRIDLIDGLGSCVPHAFASIVRALGAEREAQALHALYALSPFSP